MCNPTQHAIHRAGQRWNLGKSTKVVQTIKDTYADSTIVGSYQHNGSKVDMRVQPKHNRVLVVEPQSGNVITVWLRRSVAVAPLIRQDIVKLHNRKINSLHRRIRSVEKRYNAERADMVSRRNELDAEIRRLKLLRDELDAHMQNYEFDIEKLNDDKRKVVTSLANCSVYDELEECD